MTGTMSTLAVGRPPSLSEPSSCLSLLRDGTFIASPRLAQPRGAIRFR